MRVYGRIVYIALTPTTLSGSSQHNNTKQVQIKTKNKDTIMFST